MSTPVPPPLLVPDSFNVPGPVLDLPAYKHPWWVEIPIRRQDVPALRNEDKSESAQQDSSSDGPAPAPAPAPAQPTAPAFQEVRSFNIPVIDKDVPLPAPEILVTAVSTATVASAASVGATLAAKSLFEQVMKLAKPLTKTVLKKVAKLRKKPPPLTWARARRLERRPGTTPRSGIRDGA